MAFASDVDDLYTAIAQRNVTAVTTILDQHPELLNYQEEGCCDTIIVPHPIIAAVTANSPAIVKLLIERKAILGGSLEEAIRCKNYEIVKMVVAAGEDLNPQKYSPPIMQVLGEKPDFKMADLLISLGADVNHLSYAYVETAPRMNLPLLGASLDKPAVAAYLRRHGAWVSPTGGALHHAVERGDKDKIRRLVHAHREMLEANDALNFKPLSLAIICRKPEIASLLLDLGAPVAAGAGTDMSPLTIAIHTNQPAVVKKLLDHGAPTDDGVGVLGTSKTVPLCLASSLGQLETVRLLLEHGADPHACEWPECMTPLHCAAYAKNVEIMRLLLDYGAPVNARDRGGMTPLRRVWDAFSSDPEKTADPAVVACLMEHGGLALPVMLDPNQRPSARPARMKTPGQYYIPQLAVRRNEYNWYTPEYALGAFTQLGMFTAQYSVDGTVNVNIPGKPPVTLPVAAWQTAPPSAILDPRTLFFPREFYSDTLGLIYKEETTEEVIGDGIRTITTEAIFTNPATGRTLRVPIFSRWTLLHLRAYNDMIYSVNDEPDIDVRDIKDRTPLHLATMRAGEKGVLALLKAGADPNATDTDGWTPLLLAVKAGRTAVVKVLLANGADPRVHVHWEATAYGNIPAAATPLTLAQQSGNAEMIAMIQEALAKIRNDR